MPDSSRPFDAIREAQRHARQLMVDGVLWVVYELPASAFDRRSTTSLIFESEGAVRRVRNFPPEWRQLADEVLLELSWKR